MLLLLQSYYCTEQRRGMEQRERDKSTQGDPNAHRSASAARANQKQRSFGIRIILEKQNTGKRKANERSTYGIVFWLDLEVITIFWS
ncbi:hypothetical protein SLA2020_308690 [Shorea laevis]